MKNFQNLTVHDYLHIARRRIWYLIVPTVLVSIASAIYVWQMKSIYRSETTILVSDRLLLEDYLGTLVRQTVGDRIEFARQQLRSRTFVERIAQEFQLVDSDTNLETVLNAVIKNTEITVVPPNILKVAFYATDPNTAQAVTRRLAERITQANNAFRQDKVTVADQFLEDQLQQAANQLAQSEEKLRSFNEVHFPGVPQQGAMLESLTALQAQLATAESELQAALDERAAYERTLAEQKDVKVAASVSSPQVVPEASAAPPLSPVGPAPSPIEQRLSQKRGELAALLTRYTPAHPDVVRVAREIRELVALLADEPSPEKVRKETADATPPEVKPPTKALPEIAVSVDFYEAEIRRELQQLNRDIPRKEAMKRDLGNKIGAYSRRLNMPPDVMQEFSALTRERDAAKDRHAYLNNRRFNSDLAGKVDTEANNKTFTTIDPPNLPQNAVRPDRITLTAAGCVAGLFLGICLAFGRELLDPTLSDESAASELQIPILTSIPALLAVKRADKRRKRKVDRQTVPNNGKDTLLLSGGPDQSKRSDEIPLHSPESPVKDVILGSVGMAAEQYQFIRAQLLATQQKRGVKILMVTSAIPSEGKTFIACCLAGILARQQEKKVLLVDADLRTAKAGRAFGIEDRSSRVGLTDVLTGKADVENCLIPCADLGPYLLPAGPAVNNPVELLSSPRFQHTINDLSLLFDWVIVDSPPVLPVADASIMLPACDAAILVIRAEKTAVSLIKESINKIGRERVAGIVMNYVRDIKATHYYGHYYEGSVQAQK